MKQPLPYRLPANIVYDAVEVEKVSYDPEARQYSARVFGVCGDTVMPLIVVTRVQVRRVEEVVITDEEIDAVIVDHPEYASNRVGAALVRAFQRLQEMAIEIPEAPYA